jgi:hypothetical protein
VTKNQLHGKKFEDFVKGCGRFPGSSDSGRSATASFDIETQFDRERGLPTSIKATGNSLVGLSDARRFWGNNQSIRMIVGAYLQSADRKAFTVVHEFLLFPESLNELRGRITADEVQKLHEGIAVTRFPLGEERAARAWVQSAKREMLERSGLVMLNPKIDSKGQRRVQCSVTLKALIGVCVEGETYFRHVNRLGDFALPVDIFSSRREFGGNR